jgi:hypothetical protein
MNIYNLVQHVCADAKVTISTSGVQRLVGTLRAAGFTDTLNTHETGIATDIISSRINKLGTPSLRTAGIEAPIASTARFEEIESLRSKNKCPRCKSDMEQVKLATYELAKFCKACKVALWMDQ